MCVCVHVETYNNKLCMRLRFSHESLRIYKLNVFNASLAIRNDSEQY